MMKLKIWEIIHFAYFLLSLQDIHSIISWEHSEGESPNVYFHADLSKMSCLSTPAG